MKLGKLEVIIEKTKEDAVKHLARDLNEYLYNLEKEGIPVLFLSSGGSALFILDYIILPSLSRKALGENFTIGVLDERYDESNENNNFSQLSETNFYEKAKDAGAQFIDTRVKSEQTKEQLAQYFGTQLREWVDKNPNGKIVATAGVGSDGHTVGMMPMPNDTKLFESLFEGDELVIGYKTLNNEFSERVTTTMTFLKMVDKVFVLILGEEKFHAFPLLGKEGSLEEIPARIWKEINGDVYVDESVIKS